jgi:hypothetical protein
MVCINPSQSVNVELSWVVAQRPVHVGQTAPNRTQGSGQVWRIVYLEFEDFEDIEGGAKESMF